MLRCDRGDLTCCLQYSFRTAKALFQALKQSKTKNKGALTEQPYGLLQVYMKGMVPPKRKSGSNGAD